MNEKPASWSRDCAPLIRTVGNQKYNKMKKMIFTMLSLMVCVTMVAAVIDEPDVTFVNNSTEEFTGLVGQLVTRTGLVRFADAEIPPDPNHPVVRGAGNGWTEPKTYSLEIQGDDASHFSAIIVRRSQVSNECTVRVTYRPRALGSHHATLYVYCPNAGVPTVKIPLLGEATGVLGDLNGDGLLGIGDVTGMINLLLIGKKDIHSSDLNGDGELNITDVTTLINRLLTGL